jgi:uncharacterized protein (DUF1015 family)
MTARTSRRAESRAAAAGSGGGTTSVAVSAPYERVMMTFVNMDAPGLVILPGHRVVSDLPKFEAGNFINFARAFFTVRDISSQFDPARPTALLPETKPGDTAMLAVTRKQAFLMTAGPDAKHPALDALSPRQAQLDVVRLHKVALEAVLGISEQAIREQRHVEYLRDAGEAVSRVREGGAKADVAFLMNPVHMQQVRDVAFAGEVLPQKSTDFYPKLLSGLTIYALE